MLLDRIFELFGDDERASSSIPSSEKYTAKLPINTDNLELISSEISQLNSEEMSRFRCNVPV